MDLTLLSYTVEQYALAYNLLLFTLWWVVVKKYDGEIDVVYLIIMALFAARFYAVSMGIRARDLRDLADNSVAYYDFMQGGWWDFRIVPEAVVFIILAAVLSRRFIRNFLFSHPDYRKKNGRRKSDQE